MILSFKKLSKCPICCLLDKIYSTEVLFCLSMLPSFTGLSTDDVYLTFDLKKNYKNRPQ